MDIKTIDSKGFNVFPLREDKRPKGAWSHLQAEKGPLPDDNHSHYGLVTGFNSLEVIDIDTKVLPIPDREPFLKRYLELLSDHIEDFSTIPIAITRSGGLHILYQAKNLEGNQKLCKIENAEALIETRGAGGYVCVYDSFRQGNYGSIREITNEERDTLIGLSRSLSHDKPKAFNPTIEDKKVYTGSTDGITPWEDYDNKTDVMDLISYGFKVVGDTAKTIKVKRHGSKSPHSGYIFKDSGCLFLFSSGTHYPTEQLLSPFFIYAMDQHNGSMRAAAKQLYIEGYGSRSKPEVREQVKKVLEEKTESPTIKTKFPISVFPDIVQEYIKENTHKLGLDPDYMGCSLLWALSLCVGNTFQLEVKKGWITGGSVWLALVGGAGVGKTPTISTMIRPLKNIDGDRKQKYRKELKKFKTYEGLSKQEKEFSPQIDKPIKDQFIVNDVTMEALLNLHGQNPNGVGVFKDELAGWFKDMNKYKEGSDMEHWLSTWSGDGVSVDRLSRESDYIPNPLIPVLGGIQPDIFGTFFTSENKSSGFLDRMLFCFPDVDINYYTKEDVSQELIETYNNVITMFFDEIQKTTTIDPDGNVVPHIVTWTNDARGEWIKYHDKIVDMQRSDDTPEYLKGMLAKIKTYIPRFSLLLNTFNTAYDSKPQTEITLKSIKDAYLLALYFIEMNKTIITNNIESSKTNQAIKDKKEPIEIIKHLIISGDKVNATKLATELNISKRTVYRYIKQIKDEA